MKNFVIVRQRVEKNFTVIRNEIVRDARLSWKALGLLIYLLHLPPNWGLNLKYLSNVRPDGSHGTRTGIKELLALGYLAISRDRDRKGKFEKTIWTVTDMPTMTTSHEESRNQTLGYPEVENPNVDNPGAVVLPVEYPQPEIQPLLSTIESKNCLIKRTTTTTKRTSKGATQASDENDASSNSGVVVENLNSLFFPAVNAETIAGLRDLLSEAPPDHWQQILDETEGRRRAGFRTQGAVVGFARALVHAAKKGTFKANLAIAIQLERKQRCNVEISLESDARVSEKEMAKASEETLLKLPAGVRQRYEDAVRNLERKKCL